MSISYYCSIDTERSTADVAEVVARALTFPGSADETRARLLSTGLYADLDLWVRVSGQPGEHASELVWEYLRIPTTVRVAITVSARPPGSRRERSGGEQEQSIVGLVARILDDLAGDAVLEWDLTDDVLIMRRADRLTVTDDAGIMRDEWLVSLTGPYTREHQELG